MEKKNLPKAPSFFKILGPSFIFLGLSLGSGELILWPYLTSNWGMGIIWGAVLGITFQFFMNMEIERYALVFGESIFVGFWRRWKLLPVWFILSTFIAWGLPGFSAASGQILNRVFGFGSETLIGILVLISAGVILSLGKTLYRTMEIFQKTIILIGIPSILVLVFFLTKSSDYVSLAAGIFGKGDGFWFLPVGIPLMSFLGAFAYAGAGGNLNLAQSYYVKDKGFGMGKFAQKIKSLFAKGSGKMEIEGATFPVTGENLTEFKKWWKVVNLEHSVIFWFLGLGTIILLSLLSFSLTYGKTGMGEGISFLFAESATIGERLFPWVGILFLLVAFLMLYSTQVAVLESTSRIISENFFLLFKDKNEKVNLSGGFYLSLWGQIIFGIVILLSGFREPRTLLTLAAVINAVCMFVHLGLTYVLNQKVMPSKLKTSVIRTIVLVLAFVFFGIFSFVTFWQR